MYSVIDFLMAAKGYRFKRTNNALSIELHFERCKVFLGHKGDRKDDFLQKVTDAKLYATGNESAWIRIEPKDLANWLEGDKNLYLLAE